MVGKINDIEKYNKICKTFEYQYLDKLADLLTYFILFIYLGLNPLYLILILSRLVGVIMFNFSLNSQWLVIFPDLFKEILLYEWFIDKINVNSFTIIYSLKLIFEYVWHNYQNKNNYSKN